MQLKEQVGGSPSNHHHQPVTTVKLCHVRTHRDISLHHRLHNASVSPPQKRCCLSITAIGIALRLMLSSLKIAHTTPTTSCLVQEGDEEEVREGDGASKMGKKGFGAGRKGVRRWERETDGGGATHVRWRTSTRSTVRDGVRMVEGGARRERK
ncbi:glycosyl transferase [Sesbania bispinosa]|nr:glycosyl transferase [Sesbania bispinosa]